MAELMVFDESQIQVIHEMASLAEEMVADHYKLSSSQWLRLRYDIKTYMDLRPEEITRGPFAQIVRYEAHRKDAVLSSSTFDFYKICLQDHEILTTLKTSSGLGFRPFLLYIVLHEIIHVVRFGKFSQRFEASPYEKLAEEARVHDITDTIFKTAQMPGLTDVSRFFEQWRKPIEGFDDH